MDSRGKLHRALLALASVLTIVMVFVKGHELVILEIAVLSALALSLVLLVGRWKAEEAIRSAWASIVLAAGAVISYKLQHSGTLLLVPGIASAIFAIFAFKGFRSRKISSLGPRE